MGLAGSIGTALFLNIGRSLAAGGPLSIFLGYTITSAAIYGMVSFAKTKSLYFAS